MIRLVGMGRAAEKQIPSPFDKNLFQTELPHPRPTPSRGKGGLGLLWGG